MDISSENLPAGGFSFLSKRQTVYKEKNLQHSPMMQQLKFTRILFGLLIFSCSTQRLVIQQMTPVLQNGMASIYEESDLQLAEQAIASDIKLIEGLLKSDPENEELLLMLARGYAGYALGFAEDRDKQRAREFYLRARNHAFKILSRDLGANPETVPLDKLQALAAGLNQENVAALFWSGFSWAGYIKLSLDEPGALINLPRVEILMQRVLELQPSYFNHAVYLFFGSLYGMRPRMMGGDPDKAGAFFKQAIEKTEGKFLLAHVYAARYYAAKILDEHLFDTYLDHVLSSPLDILPEMNLINAIARRKAQLLKEKKGELF